MMRRLVVVVGVLVSVAACGGGEATPEEVAAEWYEACEAGDAEAIRALLHDDAVFIYEDGPEEPFWDAPVVSAEEYALEQAEDFDGDGETTLADITQASCAVYSGVYEEIEWECVSDDADSVDCTEIQHAKWGGAGFPYVAQLTVSDGQIAVFHQFAADEPAVMAAAEDWSAGMTSYRTWVRTNHPESFDAMFGPNEKPIMLPEAADLHRDMMEEYFAALGE